MFAQTADVEHDKCHGRISSVSTTQQKVSTTVSLTRRRYLRSNVISPEVFEFVEKFFNLDITIPTSLPHWLWGGAVSFRKHPSLKLKFLNPEMMTEEEREIKDLKEKKVKDKEEYYRKRKNGSLQQIQFYWVANCEPSSNLLVIIDLLDNLLDQTVPASHGSGRNRQQSQPYGSSSQTASIPSSAAGGGDKKDIDDSRHGDESDEVQTHDQNAEDELLVDVDVDAMMIGDLDELNYYDQRGGDDSLDKEDIPDDGKRMSADGRYRHETLSLLLRALALEGLEW